MKQLIIFLLIVIISLIGYGQYSQYKRYNSPEVNYTTDTVLNLESQNQEIVKNYYDAVENLNSYIMMQWSANGIDVRTPEDDGAETKIAVDAYNKKIAYIKYLEEKLSKTDEFTNNKASDFETNTLKNGGLNLVSSTSTKSEVEKIKSLFNPCIKLYNGQKKPLVYEVQKQLVKKGYKVKIDGVYRFETLNAIKKFEESKNLLADGYIDVLTLEKMFE
jgi:hypothetical protein